MTSQELRELAAKELEANNCEYASDLIAILENTIKAKDKQIEYWKERVGQQV